ncbi:ribonuclease [Novosphingobium sp. 9]|uniref:ribonuclease n=1 Tax=Novosphingobium sp. 9 TaxID=2025349 RepID=UPI0021B65BF3|nr:ribonuclease [Novosphingobium sp. 9]
MPEWLVEDGIGETRAILVHGDRMLEARSLWHSGADDLTVGQIAPARLIERQRGTARGLIRFESGTEALIDTLPREITTGATLNALVTREAIAEQGRHKRPQARFTTQAPRPAPGLAERLRETSHPVRTVRRFPDDPWHDLIDEARSGEIPFPGGAVLVMPTPAMTLIDIDGHLPPGALALAAVPAIADAIGHFELGGSIGIDFPTIERKEERRAVDDALAAALDHWPHQHTAINGFGFVQLVARLERPSLLHRLHHAPVAGAARELLRRGEHVAEPGVLVLTAHPQVHAASLPEWDEELARRTGRRIRRQNDPALALHAGFAQALSA